MTALSKLLHPALKQKGERPERDFDSMSLSELERLANGPANARTCVAPRRLLQFGTTSLQSSGMECDTEKRTVAC